MPTYVMKTLNTLMINWLFITALAIGLAPTLTGCSSKNANDDDTIAPEPPSTTVTSPLSVTATGSLADIVNLTGHLSLLKEAITRAGLSEKFKTGSLTLFAPTDEAFKAAGYTKAILDTLPAAELQRILQYHLLNSRLSGSSLVPGTPATIPTALVTASVTMFKATDGQVYVNASRVVQPDIGANNSVMYVINKVMPIPSQTTVELVRANPELSLFRLAIEQVGATISSVLLSPTDRGITVFAPSNAAFRAAGYTNDDAIRCADIPRLTEILRYHILNSRAFSPTFRTGDVATAQGTTVTVTSSAKGTTVTGKGNPAVAGNLLQTDLTSTNGVVHVIDRVLLPTGVSQ